jgi:hypothetical protein
MEQLVAILRGLTNAILRRQQETDFSVQNGDFSNLEIRPAEGFHYFYDASTRRLVKNFVIRAGPQVDTMCAVVLAETEEGFSPRLRFWKRDKTGGSTAQAAQEVIEAGEDSLLVKASVDLAGNEANLWKLLDFLRSFEGVALPMESRAIPIVAEGDLAGLFNGRNKSEILSTVKLHLGSDLTERDVQMLIDRRKTLEQFQRMLEDPDFLEQERVRLSLRGIEAVWQRFFEINQWIFGYGLALVSSDAFEGDRLEQITTGANVFTGGGKRIDAVMRTRGVIQSLLFAEIKRSDTPLLEPRQYRLPDVYRASDELSGAVSQVQKSTRKAVKRLEDLHRQHSKDGEFEFEVSTVRPRQIIVIGNLAELTDGTEINIEKLSSFELYRRGQSDIEIITYDELLARASFIVDSSESRSAEE